MLTSSHGVGHPPDTPARLVNSALQTWYGPESVIAGRLPFGSSVMAVASAPAR